MKIQSNNTPDNPGANRSAQNAATVQKSASTDSKDKTAQTKSTAPADRVNISGRSKEVADIMSQVNQLPDVRDAKVQDLKRQVEAGTYKVDPQKVAESILKNI